MVQLDVFSSRPLEGNPLAVFLDGRGLGDGEMQALAREMNLSETTFILPRDPSTERERGVRVRIFTVEEELPFAGHPTLGTAFAVAGPLQSALVRIETGSGVVPVSLEREGAKLVFGRMLQPVPSIAPFPDAEELLAALHLERSELPVEVYDNGVPHVYVMVPTFADVAAVRPDEARLLEVLGETGANVFAVEGGRVKTRMFFPELGIAEDPATGSAAGPLAVHLARHGRISWGDEITISQGEEVGRPSTLYARAGGSDDTVASVEVGGCAVVVAKGEFLV
jgi:trans-2,3-dihydro-3-hydroxyanthranilate isomerase